MGTYAALVAHAGSGRGTAVRVAGDVALRLREHVDRVDVLTPVTEDESRAQLAQARADGLDLLVVVGGDGAAHQAVQFCAGTDTVLGLVPCGTGNDFARALGVPSEAGAAADVLVSSVRAGHRRTLDLGQAGGRWFGTVLCSGFDALVNARANRMRWPAGPRRYDLAIVAELATMCSRPLVVHADGERLELDATLVAVGNTGWYGGGVPICPDADPADGLLDVTVVGRATRRQLVRLLPSLRTGAHLAHPAVRTWRAREVELVGNDWPVYADGESLGTLPQRITCVPDALSVVDTGRAERT